MNNNDWTRQESELLPSKQTTIRTVLVHGTSTSRIILRSSRILIPHILPKFVLSKLLRCGNAATLRFVGAFMRLSGRMIVATQGCHNISLTGALFYVREIQRRVKKTECDGLLCSTNPCTLLYTVRLCVSGCLRYLAIRKLAFAVFACPLAFFRREKMRRLTRFELRNLSDQHFSYRHNQ